MNVFELTRALVDIESVTNHEAPVGEYLFGYLSRLAAGTAGRVERCPVKADRFNVFAQWGEPVVTLSTHMDTVPPFFPAREDAECIWGRGSADAKGIIASMISAAEGLLAAGVRNFGLLFVVGEERNSAGAYAAAKDPRGSRYLINGEPTENKLAAATKGVLRYEITARGKLAHSAYPELGDSAIVRLVRLLSEMETVVLPSDPVLGPTTINVGTISGGVADNVVAPWAEARLMARLVTPAGEVWEILERWAAGRATLEQGVTVPLVRLPSLGGFPTSVAAFATDIPSLTNWGMPYLFGPGSIHVAHTPNERVSVSELERAVDAYETIALAALERLDQGSGMGKQVS